ncbi:MAG: tetratricopeptide repeat protein [Chlorobium sp.]|uniref:tetratricopeptide repeat protein n=2 Tax=Chlorobium sp. TaxID=1095 RepID=UPI0025C57FB8|nr:tetratricopeptide repeat protein [Chlorobium sp.]MCF8270796.1 tetratricopeptide repeat protein [Chlorobium sp.]MCF8287108.1 tetratricopeptide repeat protein [Chlorobium sp.]MCF8290765.1 tetratricopeptide repeat protein [Chlorobium sp.]MCF8384869.1 tetratricopeptide repeat protein [Chlorobium sp.]
MRYFLRISRLLSLLLCFFMTSCSSRVLSHPDAASSFVSEDTFSLESKNRFVKALLNAEKGDLWGALDGYRKVRPSGASAHAAVHHAMAKAFFELGVADSARSHADQAVEYLSDDRHYLRLQATIAHYMKDYAGAISAFTKLVAIQPGKTEYLSLLALEYIGSGDSEKALDIFQKMLALDPADEQTRAQVLLLEIKLQHYHDAIETLSSVIGEGEEKERLKLTLGELYMQTGQSEQAVKTYREIIAANPRFVSAWLALFEVSVQSGSRDVFLCDLSSFYDTSGMTFAQKMIPSELFYVRSAKDSTYLPPLHDMITEIDRRYPGEPATMLMKGRLLLRAKLPADAAREFRAVLRKDPSNIDAWEELVSACLFQQDYAEAIRVVASAKKRASASQMRLLVLEGYAAFQSGRTRTAVKLLEQSLQLKHREKDRWHYLQAASTLAMSYDKLGMQEKSLDMYRRVLLLDPANTLAMNNLAYMLAISGRDFETAKKLAMKAVADEPDNPVYLDTLGWVLFGLGEYQEALVYLEKASSLAPDETEITYHLISVYEKLDLHEKARLLRNRIKPAG